MISEIMGVEPCQPAPTIEKQYEKCVEELKELGAAIEAYKADESNKKKKAEVAFEGMDTVTAIVTLLHKLFDSTEIQSAVKYTNAKNRVRGYYY